MDNELQLRKSWTMTHLLLLTCGACSSVKNHCNYDILDHLSPGEVLSPMVGWLRAGKPRAPVRLAPCAAGPNSLAA